MSDALWGTRKTPYARTVCPRDCYDSCGMRVRPDGERGIAVGGDPDDPVARGSLCPKCAVSYNHSWISETGRLKTPLQRRGRKGAGEFKPVGWDEALRGIAERVVRAVADTGPLNVINTHYTGCRGVLGRDFPLRLFNRLGALEVAPDTICNVAGQIALTYLYGTGTVGADPRTISDANALLFWGVNPANTGPHALRKSFPGCRPATVCIDPLRTRTAKACDFHLQLRPGSDAALAFGFMHVLERDSLIDQSFINDHVTGWDAILPTVRSWSVERAAAATGLRGEEITEVAHLYGRGRGLIWMGMGLQRQTHGGNVVRSIGCLPAITGNLGRPGSGFFYINGMSMHGIDGDYLTAPHLRREPMPYVSQMDMHELLADASRSRVLFCWNNNIVTSNPRQNALRKALAREDLFTIAIDLFDTETTDFADVVLPAANFLEVDDLVYSYFNLTVGPQRRVKAPPGEALSNQEIFRRLARVLGFEDPELYETDRAILEKVTGDSLGISYDELCRRGNLFVSDKPVLPFADHRFLTPSSRVEIASERANVAGHGLCPRPLAEPPPEGRLLRLLSPAAEWSLNSVFTNEPRIRSKLGDPKIHLNPRDAAERQIADGDPVAVSSSVGRLEFIATLDSSLRRGVVLVYKSASSKAAPHRANVNVLNPGWKADMGEGTAVHSLAVDVERRPSTSISRMD